MCASSPRVWVEITEQPSPNGCRFRYQCEKRLSELTGSNSTADLLTYPAIRLTGPDIADVAELTVIVSLVTDDQGPPYRQHPYNLVGDRCNAGVYQCRYTDGIHEVAFPGLGIECMNSRRFLESLESRAELQLNLFNGKYIR